MIQRMDNVLIVVEDLDAAKAFFAELGMELEGETTVEGLWADQTVGLDDVRADIAMMRTPEGHGKVELSRLRVGRTTAAELELCRALASLGEGPQPIREVAQRMGREPRSLSPTRAGLIRKGLIYRTVAELDARYSDLGLGTPLRGDRMPETTPWQTRLG